MPQPTGDTFSSLILSHLQTLIQVPLTSQLVALPVICLCFSLFGFWTVWFAVLLLSILYFVLLSSSNQRKFHQDFLEFCAKPDTVDRNCGWANLLIRKWWLKHSDTCFKDLFVSIEQILSANLPNYMQSISIEIQDIDKTSPPILSSFRVVDPNSDENTIWVELEVYVLPNTSNVLIHTKLPNIKPIPLTFTNFTFFGKFQLEIQFVDNNYKQPPQLRLSLLQHPKIDFSLRSKFDLSLMSIPVLSEWIKSQLSMVLHQNLIWPQRFSVYPPNLSKPSVKAFNENKKNSTKTEKNIKTLFKSIFRSRKSIEPITDVVVFFPNREHHVLDGYKILDRTFTSSNVTTAHHDFMTSR
eukprot:TRINITY_DN11619_c0_g1_i1.p1 TRINITY_DN11619_c0_g1~~TRINITY_DN11619_c0_g1_i1.p1  ORF type:complete len:354 (-),score=44.02 TRINITY_DN11619_c0_g1_i1:91-1152(-)